MSKNLFEKMIFALMTVVVTVHAYVFYSLYVVNGQTLMNITKETSVSAAVAKQGGIYMLGRICPVWIVIVTEFILVYFL